MARKFVALVVGLVAGFVGILLVEGLSVMFYPPPADLDMTNTDAMRRYVESLPVGAFLFVLFAHAFGSLIGAFVCAAIVGQRWFTGSLIIGTVFLVAGIINLGMIPHPNWFAVVDVILYVPFSLLGGWISQAIMGRSRSKL